MEKSHEIVLKKIKVLNGFWKDKMELVRKEVIPYQWKALNDEIPEAEPSFCMRNYRVAGKILRGEIERKIKKEMVFQPLPESKEKMEDTFYGFAFQDTDFSKWIEAVAYSLTQHHDAELEKTADAAIDVVCQAQQEDGYLDTYFIIRNPEGIFSNLRDYHELYCFGHLAEGAVAYYQATGKGKLLQAVERFADYISERIGQEPEKLQGYPGHEEAELALMKLYRVTQKEKYLEMAKYFIDIRGTKPYYFDSEHPEDTPAHAVSTEDMDFAGQQIQEERYQYQQAHRPVRQQTEAVGHAVRAAYLYTGMADVAKDTQDKELFETCETLWNNITAKKMYVTGGIGGTHLGEAFSHEYDLPGDTAYAETCAAIGLVFFAHRMLQIEAKAKYADVMEKALYNGVLSGMALDGKSFFYVNPLECRPADCKKDGRKHHIKPVRQKWFGCACCPPNLARLISSIGSYAYTDTEDTLFIHMYLNSSVKKEIIGANGAKKQISIRVQGNMPWDGKFSISLQGLSPEDQLQLAIRIPEWTEGFLVRGEFFESLEQWERKGKKAKDGYLYIIPRGNEEISMEYTMPVRFLRGNAKIRETAGQVALIRGPVVYCLEETDNGRDLHLLRADLSGEIREKEEKLCEESVITIFTKGFRENYQESEELYLNEEDTPLLPVDLKWIPYYTWANRGENEMRVWVRK